MARFTPIVTLDKALGSLVKQRQDLVEKLAKIDAIFAKYGISPSKAAPAAAVAVAAQPAARKGRKRRKFPQTAEAFILGMLAGGKSVTGSDINAAWTAAGRSGRADNTLSLLFKDKKIKRTPLKEGRGSKYSAA